MPLRRLSEFVQALRGAGLRISPDEATLAMQSVAMVGYQGRRRFHDALAVTLVKSEQDRAAFENTFARFFDALDEEQADQADSPAALPVLGESSAEGLPEAVQSLLEASPETLQQRMAEASAAINFTDMQVITQQGLYTRRLLMNMGMGAVDDRVIQLSQGSPQQQADAEQLRQWRAAVRSQAASLVRRQFLLHGTGYGRELREQTMRAVAFRDLREFREVQALVRRMARRLASLHQRRLKRSKRGRLDARRTLAGSLRHDGVPARLHWQQMPPRKSRIMVICDVSSSVSEAARFLLQFLYALNDVLPHVRSFAFASRFDEISEVFSRYEPDVAVGKVLDSLSGSGTDYGQMFAEFWQRCETVVDRHTTVIILGDARNNDLPDGAEVLARIARRCRQVWWLNPEHRGQWNSGDAVMDRYLPYCRHASRCGNLNDLERAVDRLLVSLRP